MFKEVQGDLFKLADSGKFQMVVVTTNLIWKSNGEAVMGKGIALSAAKKFPGLPKAYGNRLRNDSVSDLLYGVIHYQTEQYVVRTFPTKYHWRDSSSLSLIERHLILLKDYAESNAAAYPSIGTVRPGCSNGGLDWEKTVKPLCEKYLDSKFTVVSF
jgi:hypothetical protein